MSTQGPNFPSSGADNAGVGTVAWNNPGNITASDNVFADVSLGLGEISHYLLATSFGFSIPTGATVVGIVVEWEKLSDSGNMKDSRIRIVKAGAIGASDKSVVGNWPTGGDTFISHGGATDLWGETWTPADINAANFGAALAVTENGGTAAKVNTCRITVYYDPPVGPRRKQTRTAMYEEHPERKW